MNTIQFDYAALLAHPDPFTHPFLPGYVPFLDYSSLYWIAPDESHAYRNGLRGEAWKTSLPHKYQPGSLHRPATLPHPNDPSVLNPWGLIQRLHVQVRPVTPELQAACAAHGEHWEVLSTTPWTSTLQSGGHFITPWRGHPLILLAAHEHLETL